MKKLFTVILSVVALLAVGINAEAAQYRIVDLGVNKSANGINDRGQVIGGNMFSGSGFIWDATHGAQYLDGLPSGINSSGQIVGSYYYDPSTYARLHACLWDTAISTREDLDILVGDSSHAAAINDSGQVVGDLFPQAFLWDRATGMNDLGTLNGGVSYAYDINSIGQVVGEVMGGSDGVISKAFIWDNINRMQDLGNLGGTQKWARAYAINDNGQVVGQSSNTLSASGHAFVWDRLGGMRDIDTSGRASCAWGINNSGWVVGSSTTSISIQQAFVWNATDGMVALNDLGGNNGSRAYSINSQGWIAGYSYDTNGYVHAIVWQPVPEPSSIITLVGGLAGLLGIRRRRHSQRND